MPSDAPTTSVVIPAYLPGAKLDAVLDALEPQVAGRPDREAIVVDSSGDGTARRIAEARAWLRVVALDHRTLPGGARNVGVAESRGARIAFLDADAVPVPGWLDGLEAALAPGLDAVAGAILNGTPRSFVGTGGYLLEFSEWLPRRRGPLLHAATCNLLVRREAFLGQGGFDDRARAGEDTMLTFPFGRLGRLGFAPEAAVRHLNRTSVRAFVANQRILGGAFVLVCSQVPFPHGWVGRRHFAPLTGVLRAAALVRRLARNPRELPRAIAVSPVLTLGLTAWVLGVARGPQSVADGRPLRSGREPHRSGRIGP